MTGGAGWLACGVAATSAEVFLALENIECFSGLAGSDAVGNARAGAFEPDERKGFAGVGVGAGDGATMGAGSGGGRVGAGGGVCVGSAGVGTGTGGTG